MKRFRTFVFDVNELLFVIISNQYDNEIIKDFDVYYRGEKEACISDVLRHFNSKTINYTDFMEKLVVADCRSSESVLGYSQTVLTDKKVNTTRKRGYMLDFLVSNYDGDWGLVNWNDFKRKERKNAKKKASD